MKSRQYPFSAIVDQDAMKMALLLNAVDPSIGGALIRGHKGTGKSTAARALAQLLPPIEVIENCPFNSSPLSPVPWDDGAVRSPRKRLRKKTIWRPMPFVELPQNATEDRLVGSLQIERALRTGKRSFDPGLLAAANRGILYVDEVNLLEDHLVDMLLDAAASGINVVEREGISFTHPAQFVLIGTMNPEEGELRPQFLDRFGLCAAVRSITSLNARELIVQRRLAFERDPEGFLSTWNYTDRLISKQILRARDQLKHITLPADAITTAVRLAQDLQVQGHRADITILKAARAHAALLDKIQVDNTDIAEASRLALPHRMQSSLLDSMEVLQGKIDRRLQEMGGLHGAIRKAEDPVREESEEDMAEQMQVPGSMAAGSILFAFLASKEKEDVFEPDSRIGASEIEVEGLLDADGGTRRRAKAAANARSGRYHRAVRVEDGERGYDIALDATLRHAASRRVREGAPPSERPLLLPEDLHRKQHLEPREILIVFVVDASDSMGSGAEIRMKAAKGAVLAILRKAYQNRSEVAMIAFGGEHARVILSPTSSTDVAKRLLERLPTGGATPFADGLMKSWRIIRSERLKNPGIHPILVIISDGEANVPLSEGMPPLEELGALAERIGSDGIDAVFIDVSSGHERTNDMRGIADRMRASYITMTDLTAPGVLKAVRGIH